MGGTQLAGQSYRAVVDVEDLWWGIHPDNSFYTPDGKLASYPCRWAEPRRASNPQPTAHGLVHGVWGRYLGWGPGAQGDP